MDLGNEPCRGLLRSISYLNTEGPKSEPMADFPVPQLGKFLVRRTPSFAVVLTSRSRDGARDQHRRLF